MRSLVLATSTLVIALEQQQSIITLVVTKNLTIIGTTTYVNTEVVDLKDPIISIGGGGSGADAPASTANPTRGIELRYYKSGAANSAFMGFDTNLFKYIFKTGVGNIGTSNGLVVVTWQQ